MFRYAVFQGGGAKGIGLAGALSVAEERNLKFERVAGTSAGAIVAALYAAGYTAREMSEQLGNQNLKDLLDRRLLAGLLTRRWGINRGDQLMRWIHKMLEGKGVVKFSDLKKADLRVVATDVTNRKKVIFSRENPSGLTIAEAVRISCSIPIFFEPQPIGNNLMVDGGVLSNFPIDALGDVRPDEVLGFRIGAPRAGPNKMPLGYKFPIAIVQTMLDAHDTWSITELGFSNTIQIDPVGITTMDFALTDEQKSRLFQSGVDAASNWFSENGVHDDHYVVRPDNDDDFPPVTVPHSLKSDEPIRLSISNLVRVRSEDKYLLVRGKKIPDQLQPVGGVQKVTDHAWRAILPRFNFEADRKLGDHEYRDLRISLPLSELRGFLNWYVSAEQREMSPWREFFEELVGTGILSKVNFPHMFFEKCRTHVEGIRWSPYLTTHEILIAEIFRAVPNEEQNSELSALREKGNTNDLVWAIGDDIRKLGAGQGFRIAENASWILEQYGSIGNSPLMET